MLEHPELPLHNNPAELGARTMVQRRNISYGTQTNQGTEAWDTFMSLVATTRKLGISFFEYVRDRICETETIPSLSALIDERSSDNPILLVMATRIIFYKSNFESIPLSYFYIISECFYISNCIYIDKLEPIQSLFTPKY